MTTEAKFYTQNEAVINGRHVWHYLVATPIGNYHILHYETNMLTIEEPKIYWDDLEKAERAFKTICTRILNGKL